MISKLEFKQARVITSRIGISLKRSWLILGIKLVALFLLGFLLVGIPTLAPYSGIVIGLVIGGIEITWFLNWHSIDRKIRFRETFQAMGLNNKAYIVGYLIAKIALTQLSVFVCISGAILGHNGGFSILSTPETIIFFITSMTLYMIANYGYFASINWLISDERNLHRITMIVMGVVNFYPFMQLIFGDYDSFDTIEIFQIMTSPTGAFYSLCKEYFLVRSEIDSKQILILEGILLLHAITFNLLYLWLYQIWIISPIPRSSFLESEKRCDILDIEEALFEDREDVFLKIKKLTLKYGKSVALKDVTADIYANSITSILGHNGAGKTTFINSLVKRKKPFGGQILLEGKDIYDDTFSIDIGYCPSDPILYQDMSVTEYIKFVGLLRNLDLLECRVLGALLKLRLEDVKDCMIEKLNFSERKRLTIAVALLGKPKLILLDEPTSGLATGEKQFLWRVIKSECSFDSAIIIATHDIIEAERLSNEIILFDQGAISFRGNPKEIVATFGAGYNINTNIKPEKIDVLIEIKKKFQFVDIDSLDNFNYSLMLYHKHVTKLGNLLLLLEANSIRYEILPYTLADAFESLGSERDQFFASEDLRNQMYAKHFNEKYRIRRINVLKALFYRKMALLFSSSVFFLRFIVACIIPPTIIYTLEKERTLSISDLSKIPTATMVSFLFTVSFFIQLPEEERKSGMRIYLRKMGVDSVMYVLSMFIVDCLLIFFINIANFMLLILLNIFNIDWRVVRSMIGEFSLIFVLNGVWMVSFATQSYFIQGWLLSKSVRPDIKLILINVIPTLLLSLPFALFSEFDSPITRIGIILLWVIISPTSYFFVYFMLRQNKIDANMEVYSIGLLGIVMNYIIYLSLSIFQDYREMREPGFQRIVKNSSDDIRPALLQIKYARIGNKLTITPVLECRDFSLSTNEIVGISGREASKLYAFASLLSGRISSSTGKIKHRIPRYNRGGVISLDSKNIYWPALSIQKHMNFLKILLNMRKELADEWVDLFELTAFKNNAPVQLSKGMRRKLSLIMLASGNPSLKFLYEPFTGLDPISTKRVEEICILQKQVYGGTSVIISGDIDNVCRFSDRNANFDDKFNRLIQLGDNECNPASLSNILIDLYFSINSQEDLRTLSKVISTPLYITSQEARISLPMSAGLGGAIAKVCHLQEEGIINYFQTSSQRVGEASSQGARARVSFFN